MLTLLAAGLLAATSAATHAETIRLLDDERFVLAEAEAEDTDGSRTSLEIAEAAEGVRFIEGTSVVTRSPERAAAFRARATQQSNVRQRSDDVLLINGRLTALSNEIETRVDDSLLFGDGSSTGLSEIDIIFETTDDIALNLSVTAQATPGAFARAEIVGRPDLRVRLDPVVLDESERFFASELLPPGQYRLLAQTLAESTGGTFDPEVESAALNVSLTARTVPVPAAVWPGAALLGALALRHWRHRRRQGR